MNLFPKKNTEQGHGFSGVSHSNLKICQLALLPIIDCKESNYLYLTNNFSQNVPIYLMKNRNHKIFKIYCFSRGDLTWAEVFEFLFSSNLSLNLHQISFSWTLIANFYQQSHFLCPRFRKVLDRVCRKANTNSRSSFIKKIKGHPPGYNVLGHLKKTFPMSLS